LLFCIAVLIFYFEVKLKNKQVQNSLLHSFVVAKLLFVVWRNSSCWSWT